MFINYFNRVCLYVLFDGNLLYTCSEFYIFTLSSRNSADVLTQSNNDTSSFVCGGKLMKRDDNLYFILY